ncbi:hypothetical protein [Flocculibacter collagenilyticus]|uniref:hypothetical protein n=1 Tax=Flocculibacter collagenilyticus TaxID=2744479 RepID=UPI0018F65C7C|nr:hypothetical protein [Flocculibacter collagenilyticus]
MRFKPSTLRFAVLGAITLAGTSVAHAADLSGLHGFNNQRVLNVMQASKNAAQNANLTIGAQLSQDGMKVDYQLGPFNIGIQCADGWEDVSSEYLNATGNHSYYFCDSSATLSGLNGVMTNMSPNYMLVGSDGQFYGELSDLPNNYVSSASSQFNFMSAGGPSVAFGIANGLVMQNMIDVNGDWGLEFGLKDTQHYFLFEFDTNAGAEFMSGSLTASSDTGGQKFRVIFDPLDPMGYVEGDVLGSGGWVPSGVSDDSLAVGVSYHGYMTFTANYPVYDGNEWVGLDGSDPYTLDGNLFVKGGFQLGQYPLYVNGHMMVDLDPGNVGNMKDVFKLLMPMSAINSVNIASNAELEASLGSVGPLDLSLVLGEGTWSWNKDSDVLSFWAEDTVDFSNMGGVGNEVVRLLNQSNMDTDPNFKANGYIKFGGNYGIQDFSFYAESDIKIAGLDMLNGYQQIDMSGLTLSGTTKVMGTDLTASVKASKSSCRTELSSSQSLNIGGKNLSSVSVDLCKGAAGIVDVVGYLSVAGEQVLMAGQAAANAAATTFSSAKEKINDISDLTVSLAQSGAVSFSNGKVSVGGKSFNVKNVAQSAGKMIADGINSFSISPKLNLGVFKFESSISYNAKVEAGVAKIKYTGSFKIKARNWKGKWRTKAQSSKSGTARVDSGGAYIKVGDVFGQSWLPGKSTKIRFW